jgi:hypothetical protein
VRREKAEGMGVSVNETPEKRDGNTEFTEIGTQRAQS